MRLEVSGVCYTYGKERVLDGVSFEAKENSIVSILGANGAGKTTLLKCLCNILRPNSGSITLDGREMLALKGEALARRVGFVPQRVPVSAMTVFDAVLLGRKPHVKLAVTKKDLEIVSEILEAMGLTPLALRHLHQISGGEFQKVHIARALAQEPQILILDEPSNNLDMANQHKSLHLVEAIARQRGMCTIMTMHDVNLALHYSDVFLFLAKGKVLAFGGKEIITEGLMREVYGVESEIIDHKGVPFVVPKHSSKYHLQSHAHPHDVHDHLSF